MAVKTEWCGDRVTIKFGSPEEADKYQYNVENFLNNLRNENEELRKGRDEHKHETRNLNRKLDRLRNTLTERDERIEDLKRQLNELTVMSKVDNDLDDRILRVAKLWHTWNARELECSKAMSKIQEIFPEIMEL